MTLGHAALCKTAEKLELETKKIRFDPLFDSALEVLLLDVYGILRPKPSDYEQRRLLVQKFNIMANDIFGNESGFPLVEVFGSFIMDLFTARSDLDLSLNFSNEYTTDFPRDQKISMLRKFAKSLYAHQRRGDVSGVSPIMRARVPVLKVVDRRTGIECDISVENKDGISRSSILKIISSMDERFRILSYLMKIWAKAHGINSSKDRTMNSLTIISLVAFHLQTLDPPILPPFASLFKDGTDVSSVQNAVLGFRHLSKRNEESTSKLFVALLSKLASVESLWQHGLCASNYDGKWISKTWQSGIANMSVEDFLDRSQNFARAVGKAEMQKINKCIRNSENHLSRFMEGEIEASKLKSLLFGSILLKFPSGGVVHPKRGFPSGADPVTPATVKRARHSKAKRKIRKTTANNSLPAPSIPLHPAPPRSCQVHHIETPANNSLPASSIPLHPSFAPPHSIQVHHSETLPNNSLPAPSIPRQPSFAPPRSYQVHHYESRANNSLPAPSITLHPSFAPPHIHQVHHYDTRANNSLPSPSIPLQPSFAPPRNSQVHHYETRVNTSLPAPSVHLHPSFAPPHSSQVHHYENRANNLFPAPSVHRHPSFAPPPRSYQVNHLGSSFVPSQAGYALQHQPQRPIAPHMGYASQHPQPPFSPHSGYGWEHHRPPVTNPSQFSHGWQHQQPDQNRRFR